MMLKNLFFVTALALAGQAVAGEKTPLDMRTLAGAEAAAKLAENRSNPAAAAEVAAWICKELLPESGPVTARFSAQDSGAALARVHCTTEDFKGRAGVMILSDKNVIRMTVDYVGDWSDK